jgi:hypothetical protein
VEHAGHDGGQRGRIQDQRRRVVEQAFPFDDGDEVARHPQPFEDGRGGELVGGCDDRTEHERHRPGEAGDRGVRDDGDDAGRRDDESDGEARDPPGVRAHDVGRRRDRLPEQERRQKDEQDEVRVELDPREPWDEPEHETGEYQDDGIRHVGAAGERNERNREHECRDDEPYRRLWGTAHQALFADAAGNSTARSRLSNGSPAADCKQRACVWI